LLIGMRAGEKLSLEQIQAFLKGSGEIHFEAKGQADLYEWIARTLREQGYKFEDNFALR
jgi:hypothetical protein